MIITVNNKGLSRAQMPQIGRVNTANFQSYLNGLGVNLTPANVPAASLLPTQSELNTALLAKVREGFDPKTYPLLTAIDDFVLDGHNRLYVGTEKGMNLDICNRPGPREFRHNPLDGGGRTPWGHSGPGNGKPPWTKAEKDALNEKPQPSLATLVSRYVFLQTNALLNSDREGSWEFATA